MSARIDKILDLIDDGLLDVGKQSSDEHPFPLDSWEYASEAVAANWLVANPRRHVCVSECGEDGHVASTPMSRAVSYVDRVAGRLAEQVALDAEIVYVRLYTSEPRTPDDIYREGFASEVSWSPTTVWNYGHPYTPPDTGSGR